MNIAVPRLALTAGLVLVASAAGDEPRRPQPEPDFLISESFEDPELDSREWYDFTRIKLAGQAVAGQRCIEYEWTAGSDSVQGSSPLRRLFEPTDQVYVRFHLKLSQGWGWSGRNYHPHLLHFLTTENAKWHGPAASHLTLYVEPVGGRLRLAAQDIQNKDAPHGLTQGPLRGGYNGKFYDSQDVLFDDDQWHVVEAFFKLNSLDLENDRPNADGIVRGWFDGKLVIEHTDVILRSTDFPKMKFNQLLLAPYFGPGLLPHPQKLWIDELAVGLERALDREEEAGQPAASQLRLTFPSNRHGHFDLISVNLDGGNERRLVRDSAGAMEPHWSPDGRRLAFVSFRNGAVGQIFVLDTASGETTRLTDTNAYERLPTWSPDGKKIAFTSNRTGNQDVFVMNADGTGVVNLSNRPGYDADPAWSPDGKRLLFVSMRDEQPFRLFVMAADGSGQQVLFDEQLAGWIYPDWSSRERAIVLGTPGIGNAVQVSVLDPVAGRASVITQAEGINSFARVSPDGRYIAYVHMDRQAAFVGQPIDPREAGADLMLFEVQTGKHRRLSKGDLPIWGPRPAWEPLRPRPSDRE